MIPQGAEKFRDDEWCSNPPQVTSFITYPHSQATTLRPGSTQGYTSPICGFGWRFAFSKRFHYQTPSSNDRIQELVGEMDLVFDPHLCSSMNLSSVKVNVKVSYPSADEIDFIHERVFSHITIKSEKNRDIGSYMEPPQYKGKTHIQVTITFDPSDQLALPDSSSTNSKRALRQSLDALSIVDIKFYLFSRRVDGKPVHPKALFAKSELLVSSCTFLRDLLSQDTVFSSGTPCDLFEDVPEEIAKLNVDGFEYDSDSDLDSESESLDKGKGKNCSGSVSEEGSSRESSSSATVGNTTGGLVRGRAYAINGTAYKTWKAFIYYTYTNDVAFDELRSQRNLMMPSEFNRVEDEPDSIKCSPKSMYRFADYADIPVLKSRAKEAIRKNLSKSNIINELFSSFTNRYQEIIELEVDFLVANFTPDVSRQLDEVLQVIVLGTKPDSFRVLAFTMRRLRGDSTAIAWGALDPVTGSDSTSAQVPEPSVSLIAPEIGRDATAAQESPGESGSHIEAQHSSDLTTSSPVSVFTEPSIEAGSPVPKPALFVPQPATDTNENGFANSWIGKKKKIGKKIQYY